MRETRETETIFFYGICFQEREWERERQDKEIEEIHPVPRCTYLSSPCLCPGGMSPFSYSLDYQE